MQRSVKRAVTIEKSRKIRERYLHIKFFVLQCKIFFNNMKRDILQNPKQIGGHVK